MDNTQYAQRLLSLLAQGATLCATDRKRHFHFCNGHRLCYGGLSLGALQ